MIHWDQNVGKASSTKEPGLGCLHCADTLGCGGADLEQIEVRGVPIAEVACAFKLHETTAQ